jgi:uncharacterized protein (DUF1015 family)
VALIKAFKALRPAPGLESSVAALPYDVMSSDEARAMTKGKPLSFLRADRAEVNLPPGTSPYDPSVYAKAAELLEGWKAEGVMIREPEECLYLYRLGMGERRQTGIVACASVDEYFEGRIKKHELTRVEKEEDRIRHIEAMRAQTGPIFLAHRPSPSIKALVAKKVASCAPYASFVAEDGVSHELWRIGQAETKPFIEAFAALDALYIADGHHRAASACKLCARIREGRSSIASDAEARGFLSVIFPSDELAIMDYNRVLRDYGPSSEDELLKGLKKSFAVREIGLDGLKPAARHHFGLYVKGRAYELALKPGIADEADPIASLDVSILQSLVLGPLLGIADPRTSERIDFVGGIRGMGELIGRVDAGEACAFALYPVSMDELMRIADSGNIMPPKSTWFEPKLRSGLFIHEIG